MAVPALLIPAVRLGSDPVFSYGVGAQSNEGGATIGIPWVAGPRVERLFAGSGLNVMVWKAVVNAENIEQASYEIYAAMLGEVRSANLVRVWNYVPEINRVEGGMERYRSFSVGRSRAFEDRWGSGFEDRLPAASAVGAPAGELTVIAVWGEGVAVPLENPAQVPAYRYPSEYGPRAPSFARATHFVTATDEWVFISGTAAVRGHASMAPDNLAEQVGLTLDNLSLMGRQSGIGADLGATGGWRRGFKVYLKRASDRAAVAALIGDRWSGAADHVVWVEADICRRELVVEIEATLRRPRSV